MNTWKNQEIRSCPILVTTEAADNELWLCVFTATRSSNLEQNNYNRICFRVMRMTISKKDFLELNFFVPNCLEREARPLCNLYQQYVNQLVHHSGRPGTKGILSLPQNIIVQQSIEVSSSTNCPGQ
jgi:hypothetical protein